MATVYELDDEQSYEAEIGHCAGVTGYHHWFFVKALSEALNYEFRAFAVDSAGERLGVVPLFFRRRGPVSTANFVPVGCVGPVIRGDALRAGRVNELLRWENYVIPGTKSADDLLKSMSRSRRQSINRHVRRGQDRGVTVEEPSAEEIVRWLPEQVGAVYERQGRPPLYSVAEAAALAERLAVHPGMLWRAVKGPDGAVAGVTACVVGDDRLWGWLITGEPVDGVSVQMLSYWDLIKWSLDRGLALDLGGAPNDGIRELKTSLGAEVETAVRAFQFRPRAAFKAASALRNWGPVRQNWTRTRRIIGD